MVWKFYIHNGSLWLWKYKIHSTRVLKKSELEVSVFDVSWKINERIERTGLCAYFFFRIVQTRIFLNFKLHNLSLISIRNIYRQFTKLTSFVKMKFLLHGRIACDEIFNFDLFKKSRTICAWEEWTHSIVACIFEIVIFIGELFYTACQLGGSHRCT